MQHHYHARHESGDPLPAMRLLYTALLWLMLPFVLLRLLWRARKQPEYLRDVGERFGLYPPHPGRPLIWLHTVSVGETRAAATLVARLLQEYPDHTLLLTHATPTGRAAGEQLYGERVLRAYLPYDYPFAVARFLHHFRPQLGILMETEIWPNLIHAAHRRGLPLLLLNARMSERSARGYARFAGLTREALGRLAAIAAQTDADAVRLAALGGRQVLRMGNLKFDIEPPPAMLTLGWTLRRHIGVSRRVLLAASTREGEEMLLLDDLLPRLYVPELLLVIVPRHPQRFAEVATLMEQRGIPYQRRSADGEVAPETRVLLGDSMGELFAYYAASDLAFVGGSLQPCGGQNLIESCAVGTPVLVGPHTWNFAEATQRAIAAGAALQLADVATLADAAQRLLTDAEALQQMRQHCAGFVEGNRGATEAALAVVRRFLPPA